MGCSSVRRWRRFYVREKRYTTNLMFITSNTEYAGIILKLPHYERVPIVMLKSQAGTAHYAFERIISNMYG